MMVRLRPSAKRVIAESPWSSLRQTQQQREGLRAAVETFLN
jgi:hypothetical protein